MMKGSKTNPEGNEKKLPKGSQKNVRWPTIARTK